MASVAAAARVSAVAWELAILVAKVQQLTIVWNQRVVLGPPPVWSQPTSPPPLLVDPWVGFPESYTADLKT